LSPLVFVARSRHPAEAANIVNGIIVRAFSGAGGNLICGLCRVEHAMRSVAAKSLSGLRNYRLCGTNCGEEKELAALIAPEGRFGRACPRDTGRLEGNMIGSGSGARSASRP
jgi:hypothetical protein